jgi:hypothetical protein
MTSTSIYLSAAKRADLIDQYMDCWYETQSYSTEDKADEEGAAMRAHLSALPNPELYREIKASGWDIS